MKKRILFVDDNQTLSRLTCDILHHEGYFAVAVFNAEDALAAFDEYDFDLLITDWRMEGMDGLELARTVRSRRPDMPIIMVTGYGPVESEHIRICLAKDQLFPILLETIELCLAEQEQRAEPSGTAA